MSEWVAVCVEENEEPVEIPTEIDGINTGNNENDFNVSILDIRVLVADISDGPVPRGDWVEVQEPRNKHSQGCQAAGGGGIQKGTWFLTLKK